MSESKIKEGEYRSEDDVMIEITRTIPQPDIVQTEEFSVKKIKREIIDIDEKVAKELERKKDLEKILKDNEDKIKTAVKE